MEVASVELDGQYRALREEAGFCVREAAVVSVRGADAAEYLQGQLTQDVEALAAGEGAYSALLDRKGRMQGDMRILRLGEDSVLLIAEPVAAEALTRHLTMYKVGSDAEIEDVSEGRILLSAIGPAASERVLGGPTGVEHSHREAEVGGVACRAIATDAGLDLLCAASEAPAVREALAAAGVPEVSEAATEIVRVERGRPRFGREMTTETIPQEAGINERAVSFSKGCYIGQETVARLHYKGKPNRDLRGLDLDASAVAGDPLLLDGKQVGTVGTAVTSPALGPIALAIVRREAEPGASLEVGDGNRATVVELPFDGA